MVRKLLNRFGAWLETRLRGLFGRMTPERRLLLVVIMFTVFSVLSLTMIASAIYNYGKTDDLIRIEHIESVPAWQRDSADSLKQLNYSHDGKQE